MGVPRNASIMRGSPLKTGIMLGLSPSSDPTFDMEIARATSSGVYETIGTLSPKGEGITPLYTDILPQDNRTWSYKARAVKTGWLAGDYTTAVSGKAILLPEISPNITPLTGKGIGIDVFLSTGQQVQFGSAAAPSYYRKTVRVAAVDALAATSTELYAFNGQGELYPNSTNNLDHTYFSPVGIPIGANVRGVSARVYRGTTGAKVQISLQAVNSTGGVTIAAALTSTGTGYHTMSSTVSGLAVSTGFMFNLLVVLRSNSTTKTNGRFVWCDMQYEIPALQTGI